MRGGYPALGMKKDAIPGLHQRLWTRIDEPGVYRGQCAELCGKDHGYMPIVVRAVSSEEYAAWVGEHLAARETAAQAALRDWSREELMARGGGGSTSPPARPAISRTAEGFRRPSPRSRAARSQPAPLDTHLDRVMNGKPGTAMAAFAEQLDGLRPRRGHHPSSAMRWATPWATSSSRPPSGGPLRSCGSPSRERTAGGLWK